jgi:hypothetical protein
MTPFLYQKGIKKVSTLCILESNRFYAKRNNRCYAGVRCIICVTSENKIKGWVSLSFFCEKLYFKHYSKFFFDTITIFNEQ